MGSERIGAILAALLRQGARRSGSPRPWIRRSGCWRIGTQRLGIGLRVALVGLGAALLLLEPVAAAEGLPAAGPEPVVTTTAPRQASPPAANASARLLPAQVASAKGTDIADTRRSGLPIAQLDITAPALTASALAGAPATATPAASRQIQASATPRPAAQLDIAAPVLAASAIARVPSTAPAAAIRQIQASAASRPAAQLDIAAPVLAALAIARAPTTAPAAAIRQAPASASPRPAARSGAPVDATATVTAAAATPAAASATAANNLAATASAASATNLPDKASANVSATALGNANVLSNATPIAAAHGTTRAPAATTPLERRLEQWPHWRLPAPLPRPGRGAPLWPAWFAGDWLVLDLSALDPSAAESSATLPTAHGGAPSWRARFHADGRGGTVADRAFNAAAAGRALLGDRLLSVQDDPSDPRRQLARLQGDQLLETTLVGQRGEEPSAGLFWNDELSLQVLHGPGEPRVSRVETLGRWQQRPDGGIDGEQWQARYGSPADGLRAEPVATERLRLRLVPAGPGFDPAS